MTKYAIQRCFNLVDMYHALTPIGLAFEGFNIIVEIDSLTQDDDVVRDTMRNLLG